MFHTPGQKLAQRILRISWFGRDMFAAFLRYQRVSHAAQLRVERVGGQIASTIVVLSQRTEVALRQVLSVFEILRAARKYNDKIDTFSPRYTKKNISNGCHA